MKTKKTSKLATSKAKKVTKTKKAVKVTKSTKAIKSTKAKKITKTNKVVKKAKLSSSNKVSVSNKGLNSGKTCISCKGSFLPYLLVWIIIATWVFFLINWSLNYEIDQVQEPVSNNTPNWNSLEDLETLEDIQAGRVSAIISDKSKIVNHMFLNKNQTLQLIWDEWKNVSEYYIWVWTTKASLQNAPWWDIFAETVEWLVVLVNDIPEDVTWVHVRIWSKIWGDWQDEFYYFEKEKVAVIPINDFEVKYEQEASNNANEVEKHEDLDFITTNSNTINSGKINNEVKEVEKYEEDTNSNTADLDNTSQKEKEEEKHEEEKYEEKYEEEHEEVNTINLDNTTEKEIEVKKHDIDNNPEINSINQDWDQNIINFSVDSSWNINFSWPHTDKDQAYWLQIWTKAKWKEIYNKKIPSTESSITIPIQENMKSSLDKLYVLFWTKKNGKWWDSYDNWYYYKGEK